MHRCLISGWCDRQYTRKLVNCANYLGNIYMFSCYLSVDKNIRISKLIKHNEIKVLANTTLKSDHSIKTIILGLYIQKHKAT